MKDTAEIGRRFKQVRKELKLSQAKIAKDTGYSQRSISSYETGERELPIEILKYLNVYYEVNPMWLILGGDLPVYESQIFANRVADKYAKYRKTKMSSLDNSKLSDLIQYLEENPSFLDFIWHTIQAKKSEELWKKGDDNS